MSRKKMYLITLLVGISVGVITYFTMGSSKVSLNQESVYKSANGEFIELTDKKMLYGSVSRSEATIVPIKKVDEGYFEIEKFQDESLDLSEIGKVYFLLKDDTIYFPLVKNDDEFQNIEVTDSFKLVTKEAQDEWWLHKWNCSS